MEKLLEKLLEFNGKVPESVRLQENNFEALLMLGNFTIQNYYQRIDYICASHIIALFSNYLSSYSLISRTDLLEDFSISFSTSNTKVKLNIFTSCFKIFFLMQ